MRTDWFCGSHKLSSNVRQPIYPCAGQQEVSVSKIPCNPAPGQQSPRKDGFWQKHQQEEMVEAAIHLYGSEAATAAAYCALEAWTERRHSDYGFWFEVFLRLRDRVM